MTTNSLASVALAAADPNPDVVPAAKAAADIANARAAGLKEGHAEGVKAERDRIGGILGHEAAKGREDLAKHFAFKTDLPAEAAVAALEASPKAEVPKAETQQTAFGRRMANEAPRAVNPSGEAAAPPKMIDTAGIYAARRAAARNA